MISPLQFLTPSVWLLLTVKTETLKLQVIFLGEWKKEHTASSSPQHLKLPKMGEDGALLTEVNSQ